MKVASVVAAVLLLCMAFPGSIQAKFEKPKYCVGKDGKHYLRGEHYEDKKGEKCIRYTCVRKGKKLEMNKKKISCDEPPPDVMANVTALEASVKSLQTSVESILEMVTALQFRSSQLETNVTTNIDAISTNVATLATKCDVSTCSSLQTTATDIESCLSDITSSACPLPPSGKTSVAGGIYGNTAALADKCDASTCSDIQTTVENLERNVTTNRDTININKDNISTNVASLATKCDASSCTSLQTSATDIEICLADITSSACPSPPSGKTSVAGGISGNTAALADKCDASTCSDIQTTVENLETNVKTNKATININKDDISTNVASLATKCDASSCTSLQTSATDIESCLSDITSSACPSPPNGKTSVAEGIANNTAALDGKCDASTCKDIENMVLNLGLSTAATIKATTTTKAPTVPKFEAGGISYCFSACNAGILNAAPNGDSDGAITLGGYACSEQEGGLFSKNFVGVGKAIKLPQSVKVGSLPVGPKTFAILLKHGQDYVHGQRVPREIIQRNSFILNSEPWPAARAEVNGCITQTFPDVFSKTEFVLVVVTVDEEDITVYRNGVKLGSKRCNRVPRANDEPLYLGNNHMSGTIKSFAVWNRALNQEEVESIDSTQLTCKGSSTAVTIKATTTTTTKAPTGPFLPCVGSWCRQSGTKDQFTRCESVRDGGLTCVNPEVRYGSTEGGIPGRYSTTNFNDAWCQQVLGFGSNSKATFGARDCSAPKGRLFWCAGYDESGYKWCDFHKGYWKDATLGTHSGCDNHGITSLTCSK